MLCSTEPRSMELFSVKLRSIRLYSVKFPSMELHSVEQRSMELHSNWNLNSRNTISSQKRWLKEVLWKRTFGFSLELWGGAPDVPNYNYSHFFSNFSLKYFITSNFCGFIIIFFNYNVYTANIFFDQNTLENYFKFSLFEI